MPEAPMVEAVARAICRTQCRGEAHPCDLAGDGVCKPGFCLDWRTYEDGARAAIQAMREPTSAMLNAAANLPKREAGLFQCWRAGIDAALAVPEEGREP